jgi:hypothetical protein
MLLVIRLALLVSQGRAALAGCSFQRNDEALTQAGYRTIDRRRLQPVNLRRGKLPVSRLIPVRAAIVSSTWEYIFVNRTTLLDGPICPNRN